MIKTKQIDAILSVYNSAGAVADKLSAIASIAADPKNNVLAIFLDPTLTPEQKINQIHDSIQLTEKTIRRYKKIGRYIGTIILVVYSLLQTIGLI